MSSLRASEYHEGYRGYLNASDIAGEQIEKISLERGEVMYLHLGNSKVVKLTDQGQSCCESRYMTCDDDLSVYANCALVDIEVREIEEFDDENNWGVHETQVCVIKTTRGDITIVSHNEHNGYYGGFLLALEYVEEA
jgi:hypothetical protein